MRILVDDLLCSEHCADFRELFGNSLISLGSIHALELACLGSLSALCVNAYDDSDIVVVLAYLKVLNTVAGSCMYAACTAFKSNMVTYDNG